MAVQEVIRVSVRRQQQAGWKAPKRRFLRISMALLLFAACEADSLGPEPEDCPGPLGPEVSLSVSPGTRPVLAWTPRCHMAWIMVWDSATGQTSWNVSGQGNRIPSGLRYGETPAGALELVPPAPLRTGVAYTTAVSRLLCEGECILREAGSATFRP